MKIIFFGNTKYSVIVAQKLHTEYGLTSVVTIPDRPFGRKKILTPSPVKQFALENNISVLTFDKLNHTAIKQFNNKTIDFLVVADYGLILPNTLLTFPKFAPLNVHHSLLPKYRGPSPAPNAILAGDKVSGVTIIQMTQHVDAGDILAQKEYTLRPDETTDSLLTALNTLGGELVVDVIKNYQSIKPIPQDESRASLTKHMSKQDGFIDLNNPPAPEQLDRMIRAYYPWPNVWTRWNGKIVKFLPSIVIPAKAGIHKTGKAWIPDQVRDDKFVVQMEGGKPMSLKDFLNGYPEMKSAIQRIFTLSS